MFMKQIKKNAFTLIELLAVIIILVIIALVATPIVLDIIDDARVSAGKSEANMILSGINNYCATEDVKSEMDSSYTKICTSSMNVDNVKEMVNLGNAEIKELAYDGEKLTTLVIESNNHKFTLCSGSTFVMDSETCDGTNNGGNNNEDDDIVQKPVEGNLISTLLEKYIEGSTTGLVKDATNENRYYYTGNNTQVANNFLWYGGHQWRILEFDTSAKTLTLITQQPLTSIQAASTVWKTEEAYELSHVNTWLNEYFWNSLDSSIKSNILNNTFNVGIFDNINEITTIKKVGLLDVEQYKRAGDEGSFLDIDDYFWLGNRNSSSHLQIINNGGVLSTDKPFLTRGMRPVIKIYDLTISGGEGTLTSSYYTEKKATNTNDIQVGEYINIPTNSNYCGNDNMCTFRVVSKNGESIKIVLNGLLPSERTLDDDIFADITTNFDIYTNYLNGFIESIDSKYITTGTYGVGMYENQDSYMDTISVTIIANVGFPTIGEMFSGNDIDISKSSTKTSVDVKTIENPTVSYNYWTMNKYDSTTFRVVTNHGEFSQVRSSYTYGVRPVIYLKSGLTFTSGEGTAQSPYVLE